VQNNGVRRFWVYLHNAEVIKRNSIMVGVVGILVFAEPFHERWRIPRGVNPAGFLPSDNQAWIPIQYDIVSGLMIPRNATRRILILHSNFKGLSKVTYQVSVFAALMNLCLIIHRMEYRIH
jgi:hypothetical protein